MAVPAGDARDGQAAEGPDGARHEGVLCVAMAQPPEVTPVMQLAWIFRGFSDLLKYKINFIKYVNLN